MKNGRKWYLPKNQKRKRMTMAVVKASRHSTVKTTLADSIHALARMVQNVHAAHVSIPANAAMEMVVNKVSAPKVSDVATKVTDNVLSTTTSMAASVTTAIKNVATSVNVRTTLKALVHKASTMKAAISSAALATMASTVEATTNSAAVMVSANRAMVSNVVDMASVRMATVSSAALVSVRTATASSAVTTPMQSIP